MGRKFAEIAFTPSVKAAQQHYGSRAANQAFENARNPRDTLTETEAAFIKARDGFYLATVSESGWPYVQFRGGPPGFLKVLDPDTIGYPDFAGNAQYLSVGNMAADDRASLILLDYANRRRLKIWARARVVDEADDPTLIRRLTVPDYPAQVERAVIMTIVAFDWNCPRHITPRFTAAEIAGGAASHRTQAAGPPSDRAHAGHGSCTDAPGRSTRRPPGNPPRPTVRET